MGDLTPDSVGRTRLPNGDVDVKNVTESWTASELAEAFDVDERADLEDITLAVAAALVNVDELRDAYPPARQSGALEHLAIALDGLEYLLGAEVTVVAHRDAKSVTIDVEPDEPAE